MTTPRVPFDPRDHPTAPELEGVPAEEDVDLADARDRLEEDPDDVGRNREDRADVELDEDDA